MEYVHFINNDSITVLDTSNGEQVKFFSNDDRYNQALNLISEDDYDAVFKLDVKVAVKSFFEMTDDSFDTRVTIKDGVGYIKLCGYSERIELQPEIINRIIKMQSQGFDCRPMINFLSNLYDNPRKSAIDELYLFIEACELPITEDGHFIAYKIVRDDYKDIYSGTIDNSVGAIPFMPRALVDDDRNKTCSSGLHFCSRSYLRYYGSGGSRCMLVKVNPANVVSIPSDYDNAKGRAWTYEVIGEVKGEWRTWLPNKDYTDSAVVYTSKDDGGPGWAGLDSVKPTVPPADYPKPKMTLSEIEKIVEDSSFEYVSSTSQWYNYASSYYVGRKIVKTELGCQYIDLDTYQNSFL